MKIGLLGHGVVGSGVSKIVDSKATTALSQLEICKILVKDLAEGTDSRLTVASEEIVQNPEIDLVVECMGGLEPAHTYVVEALKHGKSVVTSNKKMFATYMDELLELAQQKGVQVRYEACVGGGIPWIAEIERTRRVDAIASFRGIFNGTTNYILSGMQKSGEDFAQMLQKAQELGYAEQDPSDDIDGMDVRYKVTLSIASCFGTLVSPQEIPAYGIRKIRAKDMEYAQTMNRTIKLIGRGKQNADGSVCGVVMPCFLKKEDLMSNVSVNFNQVELDSATLGKAAFFGQGAGSLPTAHAVVQDCITISEGNQAPTEWKKATASSWDEVAMYYIHATSLDPFASVLDTQLDETTGLTSPISFSALQDLLQNVNDEMLWIAEVAE